MIKRDRAVWKCTKMPLYIKVALEIVPLKQFLEFKGAQKTKYMVFVAQI
jgi:hypothetical protein